MCPGGLSGPIRSGSLVPTWCTPVEEESDVCGGAARFRCLVTDTAGIVAELRVQLDVMWTERGAEGGATMQSLGPNGELVCVAEYDVRIVPGS